MKNFFRISRDVFWLLLGWLGFARTGRTPAKAYQAMISLFCRTGGKSNDAMSRVISWWHRPYPLSQPAGVLGWMSDDSVARVTQQLDEKGYVVFERCLPDALTDGLLKFALSQPCLRRPTSEQATAKATQVVERYEREHPAAVRYDFRTQDVIDNADVQGLMADASILAVAQGYLRCRPVSDVISMWWHTAFLHHPDEQAAQFYHFDMDRIKWLKFFIYLTDVGTDNGPHCFVEGSHRTGGIEAGLRKKGYARLTDDEVEQYYPRSRIIQFTAPRGTIIAEDTRGLHKGMHLRQADRLMLQLQFSNSLYGGTYEDARFSQILHPALAATLRRFPRTYFNYQG